LKWKQRELKIEKNRKPVHGVMICDVVPWKNTKHGIPRFQRKTLHKRGHNGSKHKHIVLK
jgi:hypothetical protein